MAVEETAPRAARGVHWHIDLNAVMKLGLPERKKNKWKATCPKRTKSLPLLCDLLMSRIPLSKTVYLESRVYCILASVLASSADISNAYDHGHRQDPGRIEGFSFCFLLFK